MTFNFVSGVHKSYDVHKDWLTAKAFPTKSIKDIKPVGGIDEGFEFHIKDQLKFPICTGFISYIQEYNQCKETGKYIDLSPMFVYKINKLHDGLTPGTEGSTTKASFDTLRLFGVCQNILSPISQENYDGQFKANEDINKDAQTNRILSYTRNATLEDILISLNEEKPVGFGMCLLSDFYKKAVKGKVTKEINGSIVGGHYMTAIGYDLDQELVKVVQSWGTGEPTDCGYMYIPFSWFNYKIKDFDNFPLLMDSYTTLDYIPPKELVLPDIITVGEKKPTIEVNGQKVETSESVFAFIGKELGRTLITLRTIEEILKKLTGQEVKVIWDEENYVVKINL
jgi:hypothetical protein